MASDILISYRRAEQDKALARSLRSAAVLDPRMKGTVASTKGSL